MRRQLFGRGNREHWIITLDAAGRLESTPKTHLGAISEIQSMRNGLKEEVKMAEPGKSASTTQATPPQRLSFTLDASTGEIIKIENVDSAGQRHELSKAEKQDLARERLGVGVEALLERAFEAGIACVLETKTAKTMKARRRKRRAFGESC